jgi:hypothetical protein
MFIPPHAAGLMADLQALGYTVTTRQLRSGSVRYRVTRPDLPSGREMTAKQMHAFRDKMVARRAMHVAQTESLLQTKNAAPRHAERQCLSRDQLIALRSEYAPYCDYAAFDEGSVAYKEGRYSNPFHADSVYAQAWDRGLEFGRRVVRAESVLNKS